ncbi:18026_t:CDS:2 [Funneliformis geosporum]|nr:18026_t:CDS:2 [Funneliformis geosporum]
MAEKLVELKQLSKRYDHKTVLNNVSFSVRKGTIHGFIGPNGAENYLLDVGYLRDIPKQEALRKLSASPLSQFRYQNCHSLSTDPSFRQDLFNNLKNIRDKGGTILMSTHILSDLQKLADDITMIKKGRIVYTAAQKTFKGFLKSEASSEVSAKIDKDLNFKSFSKVCFGEEGMDQFRLQTREKLEEYEKKLEEGDEEAKNLSFTKRMKIQFLYYLDNGTLYLLSTPYSSDNIFFFQQTECKHTEGKVYNLRDFAVKGQVDDCPYGGGAGMVLKIEPLVVALAKIQTTYPNSYLILLSPQGKKFTQADVPRLLNQAPNLVFICGHYEGFDERI